MLRSRAGADFHTTLSRRFLDALHQTEQLMGPSAEQARALERGIVELKAPRDLHLSPDESARAAQKMVELALADLVGEDSDK